MNIVKLFDGFKVRFLENPNAICGIGIIAEDLSVIDAEFPDQGILSPIEFYKYVSRTGNTSLCIWGRDVFQSLAQNDRERKELLSLFELAVTATSHAHVMYNSEEYRVHGWLCRLPEFIFGAKILKWDEVKREKQIKTSLRPDFVLNVNGVVIPGEAKIVPFTRNHLNQLQTYMNLLNADQGIIVAPSLKCPIPKSIQFFPI